MKYKLCKETLKEHEEKRVLSIITVRSSQNKALSAKEIADELHADPGVIEEVVKALVEKKIIEKVG